LLKFQQALDWAAMLGPDIESVPVAYAGVGRRGCRFHRPEPPGV
jgi:hypothetical protein